MKKLFFITLLALIFTGCKKDSTADTDGVILGTFTGDLNINSQSSLDAADIAAYINVIDGNLEVSTGGSTGITVDDVAYISSQIQSIVGDVTINTPDGSLDLSELSLVGGNYSVQGSDANDDNLLTVEGDITLNYEGDYDMPNLTSAGKIFITPIGTSTASKKTKPRALALRLPNVNICNAIAVRSIAAPLVPRALDLTPFGLNPIESIDFGPGILIEDLIAPAAIDIVLKNRKPLTKLNITAPLAAKVDIATTAVNGPINVLISIDISSTFSAPALATVQGDVAITCGSLQLPVANAISGNCSIIASAFTAPNITQVDGNLTITSDDVSMPNLVTVSGNVNVTGTSSNTVVDFANLSNVGGETEIDADDVNLNTGQPHNSGGN